MAIPNRRTPSNEPPCCKIGLGVQHITIGLVASPNVFARNIELLTRGSLDTWHAHTVAMLATLLPLGYTTKLQLDTRPRNALLYSPVSLTELNGKTDKKNPYLSRRSVTVLPLAFCICSNARYYLSQRSVGKTSIMSFLRPLIPARLLYLHRCMDDNWVKTTLEYFKPLIPDDCRLYQPFARP